MEIPRKSLVPSFKYADILEEQQKQLADNPLMKRFKESRKSLSGEKYRPLYHFVSPENIMGDPNGLCFWKGRWHMFYQGFPIEYITTSWRAVHWGHAVSDDLIHWKDLPYAIYPDPEISCFSGSTLVENDRVIAMYHATACGNMVAVSDDPLLLNWEKLTGNAVLKDSEHIDIPQIFDPCIWKDNVYYYSLSGGITPNKYGKREHRAEFLCRSKDLINWEYLHDFIDGDIWGHVGDDGACPYFWPIGSDKYILVHYSHMSGAAYLIGDYNRNENRFHVTNGGDFCFGRTCMGNVHAPSACPAPDGSGDVICIFNFNEAKPANGWERLMSLPRKFSLYDGDRLAQVPAGDIESLRKKKNSVSPMTLEANKEVMLKNISGNCMELEVEIDPLDANFVTLNVLRSPNKEEFTRITFYKNRGYRNTLHRTSEKFDSIISLDNAFSSSATDVQARLPESGEFNLPDGENLKLRIFIDKSVVEVFANERQCIGLRVYPERNDSTGVSIQAQGSEAKLISLTSWQMDSIY